MNIEVFKTASINPDVVLAILNQSVHTFHSRVKTFNGQTVFDHLSEEAVRKISGRFQLLGYSSPNEMFEDMHSEMLKNFRSEVGRGLSPQTKTISFETAVHWNPNLA